MALGPRAQGGERPAPASGPGSSLLPVPRCAVRTGPLARLMLCRRPSLSPLLVCHRQQQTPPARRCGHLVPCPQIPSSWELAVAGRAQLQSLACPTASARSAEAAAPPGGAGRPGPWCVRLPRPAQAPQEGDAQFQLTDELTEEMGQGPASGVPAPEGMTVAEGRPCQHPLLRVGGLLPCTTGSWCRDTLLLWSPGGQT